MTLKQLINEAKEKFNLHFYPAEFRGSYKDVVNFDNYIKIWLTQAYNQGKEEVLKDIYDLAVEESVSEDPSESGLYPEEIEDYANKNNLLLSLIK